MNILDNIVTIKKNIFYFWIKIILTFIILYLWLINSQLFAEESNSLIALALLGSTLTTIIYGVIFKNQSKIQKIILFFLIIDIATSLIFVFPLYYQHLMFSILSIVLLAAIAFILTSVQRIATLAIYLSCGAFAVYFNNPDYTISEAGTILFPFLVFTGVCYLIFHVISSLFRKYENQIDTLREDQKRLILKQSKMDKEIKLSSQRLEYLSKDLRKKSFEIQNILSLTDQLGGNTDSKEIISSFLLTMVGQLGSSHALYLGKKNSSANYYSVLNQKGIHDDRIKKMRIYQDSFLIQLLKSTKDSIPINKIPLNQLYKDEQELLKLFHDDLISPISNSREIIGMFILGSKLSGRIFTREDLNLISILTNQAAFILEQSKISEEIYEFYNKTVKTLLRAQELKDTYSKGHALRTAQYVQAVGIKMGMAKDDLRNLTYGTILHDIGKIITKDEILLYDKKFNGNETDIKKKILEHTLVGASILKSVGFDGSMVDMALHHHEWFNGQGFPHNLKKDQISVESRLLSVCNAFDSMLNDKPYRRSFNKDWTLEQIQKMSGSQFDPEITKLFVDEIDSNPNLIKISNRN